MSGKCGRNNTRLQLTMPLPSLGDPDWSNKSALGAGYNFETPAALLSMALPEHVCGQVQLQFPVAMAGSMHRGATPEAF